MNYDDFRLNIHRRGAEMDKWCEYGFFIVLAESYPHSLKQPYLFLGDKNADMNERMTMLRTINEIAGNKRNLFRYLFETDPPIPRDGKDNVIDGVTERLEKMLDGTQSTVTEAARNGIVPREDEVEILEHYREVMNNRDEISDIFDSFIPPTESAHDAVQKRLN